MSDESKEEGLFDRPFQQEPPEEEVTFDQEESSSTSGRRGRSRRRRSRSRRRAERSRNRREKEERRLNTAATKIQSRIRGELVRYTLYAKKQAVTLIQKIYRGYSVHKPTTTMATREINIGGVKIQARTTALQVEAIKPQPKLKKAIIHAHVEGSDHCPLSLDLSL